MTLQQGTVLSCYLAPNLPAVVPSVMLSVETHAGEAPITVELLRGIGEDIRPNKGDIVYLLPVYSDTGNQAAIASLDIVLPPATLSVGQKECYSSLGGVKLARVQMTTTVNIGTAAGTLFDVFTAIFDTIKDLQTIGSAGSHTTSPATIIIIEAARAQMATITGALV